MRYPETPKSPMNREVKIMQNEAHMDNKHNEVRESCKHERMGALLRILLGAWVFGYLGVCASSATPLDQKIVAFEKADTQTESAVADILKTGLSENRSAEAYANMKDWLTDNATDSQAVLFYAGRTAEYAGEWNDAASYYRKLLAQKSINPKLAADVVPAIYRLMINNLRDENAAYLYMRESGNELRKYGRAKQFAKWFLETALRRNDYPAIADRLASIYQTEGSYDPFVEDILEEFLRHLEAFDQTGEQLYASLKDLAAAPKTSALTRARLNWVMAVTPLLPTLSQRILDRKYDIPAGIIDEAVKASRALLAVDRIKGTELVLKGWAQWNHGDTPTFYNFFRAGREQKAKPFIEIMNGMAVSDLEEMLDLIAHDPRGRRVTLGQLIPTSAGRALVQRFPAVFNGLSAPPIDIWDKEISLEEAKSLAPLLVRNPYKDAALIRAFSRAGDKTVVNIVPAIMDGERWRFANAREAVDLVWNAGMDRSGANHKEMIDQYEQLGERHDQLQKQISKDVDTKTRMKAFMTLYQELRSDSYKTPGLLALWNDLFEKSPPADVEVMLQKLVADFVNAGVNSQDLQKHILRWALSAVQLGNNYSRIGYGPEFASGGWDRWGRHNLRKSLSKLAASLGQILKQQMNHASLSEPIFGMWLHCVDPSQDDTKNLFDALVKSTAYKNMNPAYHKMASHDLLFGSKALLEIKTGPKYYSKELLDLPDNASPASVEAAFKAVMMRVSQAPEPVAVYGLQQVAALEPMNAQIEKLALTLFNQFSPLGDYPAKQGYEQLVIKLVDKMRNPGSWGDIEPYAADLWRAAGALDDGRRHPAAEALAVFAESALEAQQASIALSVARCGLGSGIKPLDQNNSNDNAAGRRSRMRAVTGKAGEVLGVAEIPVDPTHPDYGIYKSSSEYIKGNVETAWELYTQNVARLFPDAATSEPSVLRKLPLGYSFWLLERSVDEGLREEAENLVKELTIWSRQSEGEFSLEQDGLLKIIYADLAFLKGALPTARAWYRKVADAREFQGSRMYVRAALGSVKVDRVSKNFSSALEELDKLMRVREEDSRAKVHYARAEVYMDQENYKEALGQVDAVLRKQPNHPDALILRGQVHFEMRKLVEATEIELGVSQEDNVIVPGEILKINLLDPTLSVSGVGVDIEVEVIARSGDRERLMLYQLGDSKDKFRAEVPTVLGPAVPGDKKLQILGKDAIRYGYSQRFRAKMKDLPPDPDVIITVASDAELSLSAGAFPPREGERKLDVEELGLSTAQQALGTRAVRPGNPIYVRVIDADQSQTKGVDEVVVNVRTSSGDKIRRVTLKETGPYTGEFEAIVPTAAAQAMAFASENAPGRDPNLAISPEQTAGWQGQVGEKEKARTFGVDLNDNVAFDQLKLRWGDGDVGLTHFVLQTSMNGKDWISRARFPDNSVPWDGRPRISSFPTYGRDILKVSDPDSWELPNDWSEKMELSSAKASVTYSAQYVKGITPSDDNIASGGHPGYSSLMQYRAIFYQPDAAIRRFRLTGFPADKTIFLLNGVPANPEESDDPLFIERELRPGLHEIQVWRHEARNELLKRKPVLLCDVPGEAELQPCPEGMFDPSSFPPGVRSQIPNPALITPVEQTGLDISFGENTQARLFRLVIQGFKGVAPVVMSVELTDKSGKKRLPVAQDAMKLRQNDQLEVLPGDRITALYEDPVSATPKRTRHEKRLDVAFNDAEISVSFVEVEMLQNGDRRLLLEPIRRFRHDDAILIVIDDADMDGSPDRDQVEFQVTTSDGVSTKQRAVETEPHSGQFVGRIFPVSGKPSRSSEIQISPGGTLTATYRDTENLDPGIPTDRTVTVEHAKYVIPSIGVYKMESSLIAPNREMKPKTKRDTDEKKRGRAAEVFETRAHVMYHYVSDDMLASTPIQGIIGNSLRFDVIAPHLALSGKSEIAAYVQVYTNDAPALNRPIDITRPGTLKLEALPDGAGVSSAAGYKIQRNPVPPTNKPPLDEGRFAFTVPLILDMKPSRSFATRDAADLPSSMLPEGVAVQAGDTVLIGYAWQDQNDDVRWRTATVKITSHAFLDVMNEDYSEALTSAYVGEKVYIRLQAYGLDRGTEREVASVSLRSTAGASADFTIRETEPHSGIFKGMFPIRYADDELPEKLPPVALNGLPVRYGDDIFVTYQEQEMKVSVNMGADGDIEPFSKRFTGDEMAVQTSFTLAECFFELAKKHRKLDQESLARRQMAHAQKLLSEAIATHQDNDLRAHAEYLLGNLAQEYADLSKNDTAKLPMYQEALARFSKIPVDYPETEFASKSQFKTALVYEKMGEMEIAVEEYVKLAYKYPDSEHIPEVMSRLGGYFQKKGQAFKDQADPLREETGLEAQAEVLRLDELSYPEFLRAARIFNQLQARFPDDPLAGLAGLRSAQNYMRAHQYDDAIEGFVRVYETEEYDGREIRAQAMYWYGLCHERKAALAAEGNWRARGEGITVAYEIYRRVTYDFPDSKWAKFSRGRLADPVYSDIIVKETEARERMLEGLKEQRKNIR